MKLKMKSLIGPMAVVFASGASLAFGDGGVDYAAAATGMKTEVLAALATIGVSILAIAAAIAAFRKAKGLIR
jgi:hypothetical protein